jgi:ATP-binding cassette subfamily B protein
MSDFLWPASRRSEAIRALGVQLELQPLEIPYPDLESQLPKLAPALVQIGGGYLVIIDKLTALGPDGKKNRLSLVELRSAICADLENTIVDQIDELITRARIPPAKQPAARAAFLRERLATTRIRGISLARLLPSADFWLQLRRARISHRLLALTGAHSIQYLLWILAWWIIGRNVLNPGADRSWLWLWAFALLMLVPLRVLITWLQGQIAIGAGARIKQRLFFGALRLDPDSIRHQGAGQLLGRVIETEAIESLALSGGFLGLVALIELFVSVIILGIGAGGVLQAALLIAWIGVAALIAHRYYNRSRAWTDVRLAMTHDLVESMVGHRTRLAQLPPDRWHDGEDEALERYLKASRSMDNSTAALLAIVPRGWLIVGLAGLIPAFTLGDDSTSRIAVAIGGMLLAYRALKRLAAGAWQVAGAAVAWQRVAVLYHSAAKPDVAGSPHLPAPADPHHLIDACDLTFRYTSRTEPVLHDCNFELLRGDRSVLEGPSGGGKSTLVSLLVGMREPTSGRLTMNGFDRETLGADAWRSYIAAAPQFHENHVLAETLAFNLFMGRRGFIGPKELAEAEEICRELGLGDLLERMPSGLLQQVGETGWQLSHGERSRLYIARALLQNSEIVVLDESFAALDPENLQRAVECVLKRSQSLLVIAHR